MSYKLTENQKQLAHWIWHEHKTGKLPETFLVIFVGNGVVANINGQMYHNVSVGPINFSKIRLNTFNELVAAGFLSLSHAGARDLQFGGATHVHLPAIEFTIRGGLQEAAEENFSSDKTPAIVSTLAQPHPPEIAMSLDRFRERYPDQKRVGFLIMRFIAEKPYATIVDTIKDVADKYALKIVRADEHEFHRNLLSNVRTYLHGCGFGVAIYERINSEEPNANVGLEVGYLMAMNKPVLLLKDQTIKVMQTDLAGELYKEFDPHDPRGTIPSKMTKWLEDYGIIS